MNSRLVHPRDMIRPRWRGRLHAYAFLIALVTGTVLVTLAPGSRARVAAAIYALAVAGAFGASALYHWVNGNLRSSLRLRGALARLDHSMIFVLIAGTYTPIALLVLKGTTAHVVLAVVWGGALAGVTARFAWRSAPRPLVLPLYLVLGWVAAFIVPQLIHGVGIAPFVLLCVGGMAYTVGAVVYAVRRPDPAPRVFGYHEVFHAMTLVAAICHYIAISFAVYAVA